MTEANCYFLICSRSRTRRSLEAKPTAGAPGGLEIASCFYCYRCKYLNVSSFCLLFFFFPWFLVCIFHCPPKKERAKSGERVRLRCTCGTRFETCCNCECFNRWNYSCIHVILLLFIINFLPPSWSTSGASSSLQRAKPVIAPIKTAGAPCGPSGGGRRRVPGNNDPSNQNDNRLPTNDCKLMEPADVFFFFFRRLVGKDQV